MTFKRLVFLVGSVMVLGFSSIASWYEGAQLTDRPLEWKYTALISNWVNGSVIESSSDLLAIDYFIYAAKFAPLFPLLMILSLFSIFSLITVGLFKKHRRIFTGIALAGAVLFFGAAWAVSNSPTAGLHYISILFIFLGIISGGSVFLFLHKREKEKTHLPI